MKKVTLNKFSIFLILIIFLGLFLRLVGIQHGFPFIFHPDEPTIVRSALVVRFDPNPKHFDWPHLYIYLNYFLYMIFAKFRNLLSAAGLAEKAGMLFPLIWNDNLIFYYLTRCFSAILGALTAIPVFLAGKNLFGKKAGLLGAFAMVTMPYHVWHSHYSLGDVPMVFLLSWGLYFSSLIIKKENIKNYILSGLFVGLSASVKYNGGLSALMVPIAHFLRIFREKKEDKKVRIIDFKGILSLFLSGLAAFLGFLVGTPYALLDYKTFSRTDGPQGAFWQFENVGSVSFPDHISSFFADIFGKLASNTGYIVMTFYVFGLFYLVYRLVKKKMEQKDSFLAFLYVMSLFLIWYISGFQNSRSHYYFIFYPFAAIIFGFFADCIHTTLIRNVVNLKNKKLAKILPVLFIILICLPLLIFSAKSSYAFYKGDTRNDFYLWMLDNYSPGKEVVYNDNKVEDVFGALGVRGHKGLQNVENYPELILVVLDHGPDEDKFFKKLDIPVDVLAEFDNNMRLGPDIVVYLLKKNIP